MSTYAPVRERCIRALMEKLMTIQTANGFNFNVTKVRRRRYIPGRAETPPEIHLLFGETIIDEEYNNYQNKEYATVFIWFAIPETGKQDDADLRYNLMVSNIQSCISDDDGNEPRLFDFTYPGVGRVVDVYQKNHAPKYTDTDEGMIVGRVEIQLGYIYMKKNPCRWDLDDHDPGLDIS